MQLSDGVANDIPPATATSETDSKHQGKELKGKDPARRVTGVASVSTSINGQQKIEYLIDGKTGQSLELNVRSSNERVGYNLSAPAAPRALYRGHGAHSTHRVTLPRDGTYRLLLFLTEPAANNGERADFSLEIRLRNPG
ncbi:hypothetical protein [Microbulbifer agarilyticus]|uniref:hypothetical protein n=1 Tax=Microbulbifer agarilyticus TaxID=260552 RepID=UPI001CD4FE5E|nr:hypothetical protein [Microbulbifer agarilyticus]MCA0900702.1 hypothetical protein [Microbulbifer agarilyticus]